MNKTGRVRGLKTKQILNTKGTFTCRDFGDNIKATSNLLSQMAKKGILIKQFVSNNRPSIFKVKEPQCY